ADHDGGDPLWQLEQLGLVEKHDDVGGRRLPRCDGSHRTKRQDERKHETPQHQRHQTPPAPYASIRATIRGDWAGPTLLHSTRLLRRTTSFRRETPSSSS